MIRRWYPGISLLAALLLFCGSVGADQTDYAVGQTASPELKVGMGPRPVAMGEAFVGQADDLNSTAWNPAGLSQIDGLQLGFMHNIYLQDTSLEYLAFAQEVAPGAAFGANLSFWNYGNMERLTEVNGLPQQAGYFAPSAYTFSAGYGQKILPSLATGLTVKYMYQNLDGQAYNSLAADLGMLYRPGVKGLQLGATLQNMGLSTAGSSLPMNLRAGAAYLMPAKFNPNDSWTVLGDINVPFGDVRYSSVNIGTEYWYQQTLALRAGYKIGNTGELGGTKGLTAGVGAKVGLFNIDYALASYGDLGTTHQFAVSVDFGGSKSRSETKKASRVVIPKSKRAAATSTAPATKAATLAPPKPVQAVTSSKKKPSS